MTNTTTPSMREEFEAWIKSSGGVFGYNATANMYDAWQASTAIMQPKIDALEADKARLVEVLDAFHKVVIRQNNLGASWHGELFADLMQSLADAKALLTQMKEGK